MIEVVLAVAIVGFSLVVIIGLLPTAINASRQVSDETLVTSLASDMLHWRRINPFDKPPWMPRGALALTSRNVTNISWFDADGRLATNGDNVTVYTNWLGPYFKFSYIVQDSPQFAASSNVAQVVILAEWPAVNTGTFSPAPSMSTNLLQRRIFVGEYSRTP